LVVFVSAFYYNFIAYTKEISCLNIHDCPFVQLWDLDSILQDTKNTQTNETGMIDSDDDEMELDNNPSKFSKGKTWFTMDVNVIDVLH